MLARHVESHRGVRPGSYSLVRADAGHVVIETVKGAEDADAAGGRPLIVRVYECYNQRGPVTLIFGAPILAATECNLVEEDDRPADFHGSELRFQIKPYQIRTFRVSLDAGLTMPLPSAPGPTP